MEVSETSQRPWSLFVHDEQEGGDGKISICAEGEWIATMNLRRSTAKADAALIVDAVNLKTRIDEAMADEAGYLHPVVLDGKPMVCVTPPPSEAEESRMHREYEASLLVDRERYRRGYYEAAERNDRLRDALNEVCRRVSVALNCPRHETEAIDLLVHDLLGIKECASAALGEDGK